MYFSLSFSTCTYVCICNMEKDKVIIAFLTDLCWIRKDKHKHPGSLFVYM